MSDYDIVVIGGGSAGLVACKLANGLGKKTALIEKRKLGGDCTWFGCIPSKTLIKTANIAHDIKRISKFGLASEPIELNTDNVMQHVRAVVQADAYSHPPESYKAEGIDVIFGAPKFIDSHHIVIGSQTISANKFIVCTGSHTFIPEIEGLDQIEYLTNETIFSLNELPKSMIILGGGPISAEMCCALNRLGVKVTVVEKSRHILMREEDDLANRLMDSLRDEGVRFITEHKIGSVELQDDKIVATVYGSQGESEEITADALLIAAGRRPNLDDLDLKDAGVEYNEKGIKVDKHLRTTAKNIYAAGDVVAPYLFTHIAEYEAVIATSNACLPIKRKPNYDNVPWCTFTDPELARVGMTEDQARKKYAGKVKVYSWDHKDVDRAKTDLAVNGVTKVVCDNKGKILGIHILGHGAAELMHEGQLARTLGIKFSKIAQVIHAYPSYSDAIRLPAKKCYIDLLQNNFFVALLRNITAKRNRKKVIIFGIVIVLLVILAIAGRGVLTLENLKTQSDALKQFSSDHYFWSVFSFVLVYIVAIGFSVPGATLLTLLSGFLYGTLLAALYVNVGATVGATLAFLFVRYIAGTWVQNKYGQMLEKFNTEFEKNGANYLLNMRFIPIFPFFLINIFAGLTKIRLWTYVWTTAVGILPGSLVFTNLGKQIGTLDSAKGLLKPQFWGAFIILGVFALIPVIYKKVKAFEKKIE